jgi:EAL domain-containing protein (putative c-di-GMP-specific phosphodiesterase class I)
LSARWTDGDDDARIDAVLRRRMVRAPFQPIVRVETGLTAAYQASLRGPLGSPLEHEDRLFVAANYRGVARELDELRLRTALEAAQRAKLAAPLTLFVKREAYSVLRNPGPRVEGVGLPLVARFEVGTPTDGPGHLVAAAGRARDFGWRVALAGVVGGEASNDQITSLLEAVSPDFVIVDAGASDADGRVLDPLSDYASRSGTTLVASAVDNERDAAWVVEAGIAFAYGLRFGRPDLLLRPPTVFDGDGFAPRVSEARLSGPRLR